MSDHVIHLMEWDSKTILISSEGCLIAPYLRSSLLQSQYLSFTLPASSTFILHIHTFIHLGWASPHTSFPLTHHRHHGNPMPHSPPGLRHEAGGHKWWHETWVTSDDITDILPVVHVAEYSLELVTVIYLLYIISANDLAQIFPGYYGVNI